MPESMCDVQWERTATLRHCDIATTLENVQSATHFVAVAQIRDRYWGSIPTFQFSDYQTGVRGIINDSGARGGKCLTNRLSMNCICIGAETRDSVTLPLQLPH